MSVPYTGIPLLSASRVSSSCTEQVCCISSVDIRTPSVRRTHVRWLFWLPICCI